MVFGFFQEKSSRELLLAEETPLHLFSWDFHRFLLPPGLTSEAQGRLVDWLLVCGFSGFSG